MQGFKEAGERLMIAGKIAAEGRGRNDPFVLLSWVISAGKWSATIGVGSARWTGWNDTPERAVADAIANVPPAFSADTLAATLGIEAAA